MIFMQPPFIFLYLNFAYQVFICGVEYNIHTTSKILCTEVEVVFMD